MATPLVSVLMAVYNAEPYLENALRSLLQQTCQEIEVLAVDDASTDGSLRLLQQWSDRDHRLHVFHQEQNQGQAVARNLALKQARGEYVCMLDADDWLSPDALERAVEVFRRYPHTDSVLFRLLRYYQQDGREEVYPTPDVECLTGEEAFRLSLDWTLHGLYLVRRDIHLRYPYDDSCRLYSDDNTTRLHYLHSREVRFCSGIYYYRQHPGSSTSAVTPRRFLYMLANLSMKRTLEQEGVSDDVLRFYEIHRWHNYLGQLWLYYAHCRQFTKEERNQLLSQFRLVYDTFSRRLPFAWVYAEQWLRWRTKKIRRKVNFSLFSFNFKLY